MKIEFNIPPYLGDEPETIADAARRHKIAGDGYYTKACQGILEERTGTHKALLTSSCTDALEMAALLTEIGPGDEVIAASYTFVSTVLPFVLRGASIVFIDVDPTTMNLDLAALEEAIGPKTKVICLTHYAGVAVDMDRVMEIAKKQDLLVVEDAAQGVMSQYKGRALGSIGHLGCYSFHETKNYSSGEGGALLVNDPRFLERAEILREKGTNRSQFHQGLVDKYTWHDLGSSFLMSDINAAYLYPQFLRMDEINEARLALHALYQRRLSGHPELELQEIPSYATHNAHMFYIKLKDNATRTSLTAHLKDQGIGAVFHYIPLHSSPAGLRHGRFHGADLHTTKDSERLLRLPLYFGLTEKEVEEVCDAVLGFFGSTLKENRP